MIGTIGTRTETIMVQVLAPTMAHVCIMFIYMCGGPIKMIAIKISLPWATQRITQILKNYDQTSRRSNSGSRGALKSSKFDGQNDGQVDCPVVTV